MKKLVSTQGLMYGHFDAVEICDAIYNRVNKKLENDYNNNSRNGDIHVGTRFSYDLMEGLVTAITLIYTIDNPTRQRLEDFRDTCNSFFQVYGFVIEYNVCTPYVFLKATDDYDKASLIHALDFLSVSLESVMCAIDTSLTEKDAIYSPSGTYILQLPDVPRYSIREGTLFISPFAARNCKRLRELEVPDSLVNLNDVIADYPYRLKVKEVKSEDDSETSDEEDSDRYDVKCDEYDVCYSQDGKILRYCYNTFNEIRYEVPDGVEEIDDFAFQLCRHYLELSIPRSVRVIGDYIFGNGGRIEIRDE